MRPFVNSAIWLLVAILALAVCGQVWQIGQKLADNRAIHALAGRHDQAVPLNADPELLLARGHFLSFRDRIEEAIPFLDALTRQGHAVQAEKLDFDIANARVRRAFAAIDKGDIDKAGAEIALAKNAYRRVLWQQPQAWNAKQNLDVVSRLVRDFPKLAPNEDAEEPAPPSSDLWTELPAQPRGLP